MVQVLLMLLLPNFWTRHREACIIGQDACTALSLTYERLAGHPIEALHYATGGAVRLLPHPALIHVLSEQRPKATVLRWAFGWLPQLLFCLHLARPGVAGIEGLLYRAETERGRWLVGVCLVYAASQLVLALGLPWITDIACRRAFIKTIASRSSHKMRRRHKRVSVGVLIV